LAAALPTFYAGWPDVLIASDAEPDDGVVRALLERGLPWSVRAALRKSGKSPVLLARGRLALGQRYWRAVDFDEALFALRGTPDATNPAAKGEAVLLQGLALALREGPETAAAMMLHPPSRGLPVGNTALLDAIPRDPPLGPLAAYDAALLARLAAPRAPDPKYWRAVADRFDAAAKLLADDKARQNATHYRDEALAVAAAPR
jgi:hypothetical protein